MSIGKHVEASEWYAKSVTLCEQLFDELHPQLIHTLNALGNSLLLKGDFEEAIQYFNKVADIQIKEKDTNYLITAHNIACVEFKRGNCREAFIGILANLKTIHDSPNYFTPNLLAATYETLGKICEKMPSFGDPIKWYRSAFDCFFDTYGGGHPNTIKAWDNIFVYYKRKRDYLNCIKWVLRFRLSKIKKL